MNKIKGCYYKSRYLDRTIRLKLRIGILSILRRFYVFCVGKLIIVVKIIFVREENLGKVVMMTMKIVIFFLFALKVVLCLLCVV